MAHRISEIPHYFWKAPRGTRLTLQGATDIRVGRPVLAHSDIHVVMHEPATVENGWKDTLWLVSKCNCEVALVADAVVVYVYQVQPPDELAVVLQDIVHNESIKSLRTYVER